jgi:mono/diheme cytochrome c family protein
MDFPSFQVPDVGHGMTIGTNAVIHVIVSHGVAIGLFFFIWVTELIGYLRRDPVWDRYARFAIVPTAVVITSLGAITGVGIWFTIGTLAPRAASSMLRNFFWPWWLESWDFLLEEIILLCYYLLWEKLSTPRGKLIHLSLGFSYVAAAFVSTLLITGIIGFQLTPDSWLWDQSRWIAWNNPSLWPQTFLRFFGGLTLGSVLAPGLLFFWRKEPDQEKLALFRRRSLRLYGVATIVFFAATLVSWLWYFSRIEPTFRINFRFAILTSHLSQVPHWFWIFLGVSAGLVLLLAVINVVGWRLGAKVVVIPALLGAIALTAGFERMREFMRGPYVMASWLYASEWTAMETARFEDQGLLPQLYWLHASSPNPSARQASHALFGNSCTTCHTAGGLNAIRDRVAGRPPDGIAAIINHTNEMVPWMPPFAGNRDESELMAQYFYDLAHTPSPATPAYYAQPAPEERP